MHEGRRSVKKDAYSFWTVKYKAMYGALHNPYVFPLSVSQIFFMPDAMDSDWKVVLQADARRKRIVGDHDIVDFGAAETQGNGPCPRSTTAGSSMTRNSHTEEPEVEFLF